MYKLVKWGLSSLLALSLVLPPKMPGFFLPPEVHAAEKQKVIELVQESSQIFSEGAVHTAYTAILPDEKKVLLDVIEVDLTNPYVEVKPMAGHNQHFTEKQSVQKMVEEYGAAAGINTDYFVMAKEGGPFGHIVLDGELLSTQIKHDGFRNLAITQERKAVILPVPFKGEVTAPDGSSFVLNEINNSEYFPESTPGASSHSGALVMYTPYWGLNSPGVMPGYSSSPIIEMSVRGDRVDQIAVYPAGAPVQDGIDIPQDGYVLWGHAQGGQFLIDHFQPGDLVEWSWDPGPAVNWLNSVGAYTELVLQGRPLDPINTPNSIKGRHARTVAGADQSGTRLILVTAEKSAQSAGATLEEMAQILVRLGAWEGVNLDGGGSTTMVVRQLGDTASSLVLTPQGGTQRAVPVGLGIFNTAPPGDLEGLLISGRQKLLIGDQVSYTAKAYDSHYNPYAFQQSELEWFDTKGLGQFTLNNWQALSPGETRIVAELNGVTGELPVSVYGAEDLERLLVSPRAFYIRPGEVWPLTIQAETKDGQILSVRPQNLAITFEGVEASITPQGVQAGAAPGEGTMILEYGGALRLEVPVVIGEHREAWLNFEGFEGAFNFAGVPADLKGQVSKVKYPQERVYRGQEGFKLSYQFKEQDPGDAQIAYGRFAEDLPLPGQPLGIGAWVYGDHSSHWLRAEIVDAKGKVSWITLADQINWSGWKWVEGDFPNDLSYPLAMRSFYVVDLPEGRASRPRTGTIYIDEAALIQPGSRPPFEDIYGHWAEDGIASAYQIGLANGTSETTFTPNRTVSRAEMVSFLARALAWEKPAEPVAVNFKDEIPAWAQENVELALAYGVIEGFDDGSFRPNEPITRAQMAVMLDRALKLEETGLKPVETPFKDEAQVPAWAKDGVARAGASGLMVGMGGFFKPAASATRAEAVVVSLRAMNNLVLNKND